jgi:nucleotide-binding universal stress UspA family protein
MKKILIPTDFSDNAENALKVAAQIARANQSELILLHMLELPSQGGDAIVASHNIPELMLFKNVAIEKLDNLMEADYLDGLEVSEVVQFEMAFDGIMNISKKNDVDLIVMGSHGASGFKEMFIGSNAEKVVRSSEVPVLIIKKEIDEFSVKNFVFASDFSEEITKPFQKAVEIAEMFGAHLHLVMVNTLNNFKSTEASNQIFNSFLKESNVKNYSTHIYNDATIEKGVLHFAKSIDADLIGICTHGRNGLSHFFNGSVSEDLVNHAMRPIITFKI